VPGYPLTLNNAVGRLLKAEFDGHRAAGTPHPLFASVGLDAVPFRHPDLEIWRNSFKGLRWLDPDSGWTLFGAVDDVWATTEERLIVADYKATARAENMTAENMYPSYRQQLEVYQFLLRTVGFQVESRAWLVYANGRPDRPAPDATLSFRMSMLPCDGDTAWVLDSFRAAVALIQGGAAPTPSTSCKWCLYVQRRAASGKRAVPDGFLNPEGTGFSKATQAKIDDFNKNIGQALVNNLNRNVKKKPTPKTP